MRKKLWILVVSWWLLINSGLFAEESLLPNGSFEEDPLLTTQEEGWDTIGPFKFKEGDSWEWATDFSHSGQHSLKLSREKIGDYYNGVSSPSLPYRGERIKVSFWLKMKDVVGDEKTPWNKFFALVYYLPGKEKYPSLSHEVITIREGTYDWEKVEKVLRTAPKETKYFRIELRLQNCQGTVWIDDMEVSSTGIKVKNFTQSNPAGIPFQQEFPLKLSNIEKKIEVLDKLVSDADNKDIGVPYQKISLRVAKLFREFIKADAKDEKRQMLAISELDHLDKILTNATEEITAILKDPHLQVKRPIFEEFEALPITIKNGTFYSGDKPVFLSGISYPGYVANYYTPELIKTNMRILKGMGENLIFLETIATPMKGFDQDKEDLNQRFDRRFLPILSAARNEGFLFAAWLPLAASHCPWLAKIDPDIAQELGLGFKLNFEHPLGEKFWRQWLTYAASRLKEWRPWCLSNTFLGESVLDGFSKYTIGYYEEWLEKKYKKIDILNKVWKSNYQDFKEAASQNIPASKENRAKYYDWHTFNQYRANSYAEGQRDIIKKIEGPTALTGRYVYNEGIMVKNENRHIRGIDPEAAYRRHSVSSCDSRPVIGENIWEMCEERYSFDWITESFGYDFAKSVAPNNPILNMEWHAVWTSVYHRPNIPANYMRTVLWLSHCHGMAAHLIWGWRRKGGKFQGDEPRGYFEDSFTNQPQLVESRARTMFELRGLINYIIKFPQLERRVRILFSEPSAIQSDHDKYLSAMCKVYESLYFLDYPVGFVTENQIKEGKLSDISILVIPLAEYIKEETYQRIKEYQKNGGRVVIIGQDSLMYDEYGRKREPSEVFKKSMVLSIDSPVKELSAKLDRIMDEVGIERPVRLLEKKGGNAHGVELRTVKEGDKKIFYLINLNRYNVEITLKTKGKVDEIRTLTRNKVLKINQPFILEPMNPVLVEVKTID